MIKNIWTSTFLFGTPLFVYLVSVMVSVSEADIDLLFKDIYFKNKATMAANSGMLI